jgi:hypothetical protein
VNDVTRVISIAGSDRSGSTLLDTILGTVEGFFSTGELRYLWQRGVLEERRCGCGRPIPECEVWGAALSALAEQDGAPDPATMVRELDLLRTRYAPLAMAPPSRGRYIHRIQPIVDVYSRLLPIVREITGSRVIVDSSKRPLYTFMLSQVPGVELTVVHIVRDPRAVAHSRNRYKRQLDTAERRGMTQAPPLRSALSWAMWNIGVRSLAGRLPRYVVVRYEDLIADPEATTRRIVGVAGAADASTPFIDGSTVTLQPNHTVSGNPSRFRTGDIELRMDAAWERDMRAFDRRLVTAVTLPLLGRYGYPLRTG